MNAAVTWFYNNNLDALTSLLMLCHEHGWPICNEKVDIKELIVTYYHSSKLPRYIAFNMIRYDMNNAYLWPDSRLSLVLCGSDTIQVYS